MQITRREWAKIAAANLAILLIAYCAAAICTACGSDFFAVQYSNPSLDGIERTLRSWNCFAIVQIGFSSIEAFIIASYETKSRPRWWMAAGYFVTASVSDVIMTLAVGRFPFWFAYILNAVLFALAPLSRGKKGKEYLLCLLRAFVGVCVSFALNTAIEYFRTSVLSYQKDISLSIGFCLSMEYDLALGLALLTLALVFPREKGEKICQTIPGVCGGSSTMTKQSQRSLPILSVETRNRIRRFRIRAGIEQTLSLIAIAFVPYLFGKEAEFALVFVSFTITRLILGFKNSLHFASELKCIGIGSVCFIALSYLAPSVEASVIFSLCYGTAFAICLRLYWELKDLRLYRKAAKPDCYAEIYAIFKGNLDEDHIYGAMRMRGFSNHEIALVQSYARKDEIDYIASNFAMSPRAVNYEMSKIIKRLKRR